MSVDDRLGSAVSAAHTVVADLPSESPGNSVIDLHSGGRPGWSARYATLVAVAAVVLLVVTALLLPGWLSRSSNRPRPATSPSSTAYVGHLNSYRGAYAVTAELPAGWGAATDPGYGFDVRSSDNSRGVVILAFPTATAQLLQVATVPLNNPTDYRMARLIAKAGGQAAVVTATTLNAQPAWQVDAEVSSNIGPTRSCAVPVSCVPLLRSEYAATHVIGLLPGRISCMIFGSVGVKAVVWIWDSHEGRLRQTLTEVQPILATLHVGRYHVHPAS